MEISRVNNKLLEQLENDVHSMEYLAGSRSQAKIPGQ